ncbi:hypothetical protein CPC08DRAFT_221949 [Agrocybe pediades]|nr:hypothetical protein CPC08DRAFT_221949 [Agrocybe pediades]
MHKIEGCRVADHAWCVPDSIQTSSNSDICRGLPTPLQTAFHVVRHGRPCSPYLVLPFPATYHS